MSESGSSTRTVVIALTANAAIAVAKGIGGAMSGSGALLSEAAHSVADTLNEAFLLTALRRSGRPADEQHPFGYGQERFVWSLLAAVGIFVAGAMFSFFQGYRTLSTDDESTSGFIASYVVLAIAFVFEGTSWLRAVRQLRGEARAAGRGMVQHIRLSDDPTVKTVASEDTAALVGLLIAFLGILLHQLTGSAVPDGTASVLIGIVLVYVAFALGRDSIGLLTGEAANPEVRKRLLRQLRGFAGVTEVIDLQTMQIGTGRLLVAVRLDFDPQLGSDQVEQLSATIERELQQAVPEVDQLFLDATAATETSAVERRKARQQATRHRGSQ